MKKFLILIFCFAFAPVFILAQEKIDINTATQEQLEILTGIGPVYAQRIIEARPFSSLDDLLRVNGIGEKTLQKIKDQGLAYIKEIAVAEEKPTEALEKVIEIGPIEVFPENIFFSKIMPSPDGADADNEYIELKNTNNFEVDLKGWVIKDKQGSIKEYTLQTTIPAAGSLLLFRLETKITLNNDGDGLELLNPLKEVVDSVDFGKSQVGIAYIKTSSGWQWDAPKPAETSRQISPGPEKKPEDARLPDGQGPRVTQEVNKIDLSADPQKSSPAIYLTGFLVALISSVLFLVIKKRLS